MSSLEIIISFGVNLAAGVAIFLMGLWWRFITPYVTGELRAFRHVFGVKAVGSGFLTVTLDVYQDLRLLPPDVRASLGAHPLQDAAPQQHRFFKLFPDHHVTAFPGAYGGILGYCSARAAAYLADRVGEVRGISVLVASDEEVAATWEGTFISVGSSASNVKTNDIKLLPENPWLRDDLGQFSFKDGRVIAMEDRADKGIILKLRNPYFTGYSVLLCAGLGEWGTSGAAWFLSRHWRTLSRRFGDRAFLVAVSVVPGSDESAREILSLGEETRSWRAWSWLRSRKRL